MIIKCNVQISNNGKNVLMMELVLSEGTYSTDNQNHGHDKSGQVECRGC